MKAFYQVVGEATNNKLTSYELAFHDKVLGVTVNTTNPNEEGRTSFADDIEAEDLAAEERKKSLKSQKKCMIS